LEKHELLADTTFLVDLSMPVMTGLEATKEIRHYEETRRIKPAIIVALTGLASASTQSEAFGSGINLFLTKPASLAKIRGILQDWKDSQL
jgi:CheY-like chemotaxis protein